MITLPTGTKLKNVVIDIAHQSDRLKGRTADDVSQALQLFDFELGDRTGFSHLGIGKQSLAAPLFSFILTSMTTEAPVTIRVNHVERYATAQVQG